MEEGKRNRFLFFEFGNHYGGSLQSTVLLIHKLQRLSDIVVFDVFGTSSRYIEDLQKTGARVVVLFPTWSGKTTIGGTNLIHRLIQMLLYIPNIVRIVIRLRKKISEEKPKAVWVNSEKALFVCWLAVHSRIPLLIYVRGELLKIRRYCFLAWRRVSLAIGVSKKSLQYLRSTKFAHGNFLVIYNGIDVDETQVISNLNTDCLPKLEPGVLRILLSASIGSPLKGQEIAILALAEYIYAGGKANLIICGDVPSGAPSNYFEKIQKLVCKLNLQSSVIFLGWRRDILPIMGVSDIILLPSFSEGFPRSLLQGMALGKPVIATRVGGIPELIRDGLDGLLVTPGDISALAKAFSVLADPDLRERMGKTAQSRVIGKFSLIKQAQEFYNSLTRL